MSMLKSIPQGYIRPTPPRLLDRLCRENGLEIALRDDQTIALIFKGDHITQQRTVSVSHSEGDVIMCFQCPCRAAFTNRNLPEDLLPVMLARNADVPMGAWVAQIANGTIKLSLQYTALTGGMDAKAFQLVCTLMLKEVAEIELSLSRKGLL
jgi:hypothetical protein